MSNLRASSRDDAATLVSAALVALVGAVVLGVVGMHALAHHDPARSSGSAHEVVRATSAAMGSVPPPRPSPVEVHLPDGSTGDTVMLCAAMLLAVAAGAVLALRLGRCRPHVPIGTRPRPVDHAVPLDSRPGSGPPAVWEHSVIRC